MWAKVNVIKSYLRLQYKFRQANFKDVTDNYYSFKKQFRNTIGGLIDLNPFPNLNVNCDYEHWWKYTAGLVQPIGIFIFNADKQWLQGDKVKVSASYRVRDHLRLEASGHLLFTTLPYRDYNVQGGFFWQF